MNFHTGMVVPRTPITLPYLKDKKKNFEAYFRNNPEITGDLNFVLSSSPAILANSTVAAYAALIGQQFWDNCLLPVYYTDLGDLETIFECMWKITKFRVGNVLMMDHGWTHRLGKLTEGDMQTWALWFLTERIKPGGGLLLNSCGVGVSIAQTIAISMKREDVRISAPNHKILFNPKDWNSMFTSGNWKIGFNCENIVPVRWKRGVELRTKNDVTQEHTLEEDQGSNFFHYGLT